MNALSPDAGRRLRVLFLEDNPDDAFLLQLELERAGYTLDALQADSREAFEAYLHTELDLIFSDHSMPGFDAIQALEFIRERGYDVPFIIISGTILEEVAVQAMRMGAADYLLKDRLARLGPAVEKALEEHRLRQAQKEMLASLQEFKKRFQDLAASIPGMIYQFVLRPDGTREFPYVSEGARDIYGLEPEAIMADASLVFDIVHPEDKDTFGSTNARSAETLEPWRWAGRVVLSDGQVKWLQGASRPQQRADGSILWNGVLLDATERKAAEQQLAESEARFQTLLRALDDVVWSGSLDGSEMYYINAATERMYGVPRERFLEDTALWMKLVHPEDQAIAEESLRRLQANGQAEAEYRIVRPDGEIRWLSDRKIIITDEAGTPQRIGGIATDITARKKAEQKLLESEARARRLALVASRTTNGVIIADAEGRIEWVNEGFTRLSGYTPDEVIGQKPGHMLQGPASDPETVAYMRRRIRQQKGFKAELVNYTKAQNPYWVNIEVRPLLDEQGTFTGFMGIETEITERKLAEEAIRTGQQRLHMALDAAQMGIWDWNLKTDFFRISDHLFDLFQIPRSQFEETSESFLSLVHPEDRPVVRAHFDAVLHHHAELNLEYRLVTNDGTTRWVGVRGSLQRDVQGSPARLIGTAGDITARKTYEAGLVEAKERAEEMSRLKSTFLMNMSHEIRTPLTGIIGFSELLTSPDTEIEEVQTYAAMIQHSGKRLMETLNSVLDLAQLESGSMELHIEPVNVGLQMREAVNFFNQQATDKGLRFEVHLPSPPLYARADRIAFDRVLSNLISNAIKFTPQGTITVSADTDGETVQVHVTDTGIGIDASFIPYLFDEFKQESSGLSRDYEGTGLGLTISQRLVRAMQGTIHVESEKGKGSRFTVHLPRADAGLSAPERPAPVSGRSVTDVPARLLVVDDNLQTRYLLQTILAAEYDLDVAETTTAALDALRSARYDAVLLDIDLGEAESGVDLLPTIRALPGYDTVPIIACTAYALPNDKQRFRRAGFNAYLAKPFTRTKLFEVLGSVLA